MTLTGNDLKDIGFPETKAIGIALAILQQQYAGLNADDQLALMKDVISQPADFEKHEKLQPLAQELLKPADSTIALNDQPPSYQIYGAEAIEQGAITQMETAMKLPITVAGALMPDAHQGYGLPIGGVLATNNAVIPFGVGVDIGCRMCLTAYPLDEKFLERHRSNLKQILIDNTFFGRESARKPKDHEVINSK